MTGKSMELNIQMFAEGGSGEGSGVSAAVAQPQTSGDGGVSATNTPDAGEKKNEESTPQSPSGDSSPASGADGASDSEGVTLDSFFEKHPELKKENDKRTQKAVQSRLYQQSKSIKPMQDFVDKMMILHNVKSVEELEAKFGKSIPDEYSMQNGYEGEAGSKLFEYQLDKLQRERMYEEYQREQKVARQLEKWNQEAAEVMKIYPDFNLEAELQNPDFTRLISAKDDRYRMPMKQIYEMIHHDELMKAAEKRVADAYSKSVNTNKQRPPENGTGNQSAVSGAMDVSKLSKKDRADLAKRAGRGEVITL